MFRFRDRREPRRAFPVFAAGRRKAHAGRVLHPESPRVMFLGFDQFTSARCAGEARAGIKALTHPPAQDSESRLREHAAHLQAEARDQIGGRGLHVRAIALSAEAVRRALGLKAGDAVPLLLDGRKCVTGTVAFISPVTGPASGTVRVKFTIENSTGEHRSGVRCARAAAE